MKEREREMRGVLKKVKPGRNRKKQRTVIILRVVEGVAQERWREGGARRREERERWKKDVRGMREGRREGGVA